MNATRPSDRRSLRLPTDMLLAPGIPLSDEDAATVWREIALDRWEVIAAIDTDGVRHAAIVPAATKLAVDWRILRAQERHVLRLVARGYAQKVIAMKLGMSPTSVSLAFRSARDRLGFSSAPQLVCAYRDAWDTAEDDIVEP